MTGCFFRGLTRELLHCGVFAGVPELLVTVGAYIARCNTHPKPFVWTQSARSIL